MMFSAERVADLWMNAYMYALVAIGLCLWVYVIKFWGDGN